jgi:hypothetical protein
MKMKKIAAIVLFLFLCACNTTNNQVLIETTHGEIKTVGKPLAFEVNPNKLPSCPRAIAWEKSQGIEVGPKGRTAQWKNCWGRFEFYSTDLVLEGEWQDGYLNGLGTNSKNRYHGYFKNGVADGFGKSTSEFGTYIGMWKKGEHDGDGIFFYPEGNRLEGEFYNGQFLRRKKIDIAKISNNLILDLNYNLHSYEVAEQRLNEGRWRFAKGKLDPDFSNKRKFELKVSQTKIATDGSFTINIQTAVDIASLQINGEEHGGSKNGIYSIGKVARAGQETEFTIVATDTNGNSDTKTIRVNRPVIESQAKFTPLNPVQIRKQPDRDAVAIIIGIADYKNLPRAEFANDDASVFYDYAIRALGIKPENIKLLVDANADEVAIYQAFKTWLPSRVRPTTDVYVFYSGHGLPGTDGQGLYLLPQRAHRDLIEKTAISQSEINSFIQSAKPRSVTIFLDSCYSGLARSGEALLASARPVMLKSDKKLFPDDFTVITASQADQISSSSPDLKHGIFSYYLMRGMEGEADSDKDGRITVGEMHRYLSEQVARQAGMMNRRQEPQIVGDLDRILVGN